MPGMPKTHANGIEIEYDVFGESGGDPLLLVMGLGGQMIMWDEEFCEMLAGRGHRVVRYDNRDVGLSTKFGEAGAPNVLEAMQQAAQGQPIDAPYTLDDMADDAAGLLDALEINAAHVCGASMGGMIVQALTIRHPQRVRSMVSIMSTTGNPELPPAKPEAMQFLMTPPPTDRAGNIERAVQANRVIGSPGFPADEERLRERAARMYDRSFHPEGVSRQLLGIVASGSRTESLRQVTTPTLVIHGVDDPLVPVEGGMDTHRSIPGSELLLIDGMGHDLPRQAWPRIVDAIRSHTEKTR